MEGLAEQDKTVLAGLRQEAAQSGLDDHWLVLEGDWGGQIYLTVPLGLVGDNARIVSFLRRLDQLAWECNEGQGASLYLYSPTETARICGPDPANRRYVGGGMGGGRLQRKLWLHEEFRCLVIKLETAEMLDLKKK